MKYLVPEPTKAQIKNIQDFLLNPDTVTLCVEPSTLVCNVPLPWTVLQASANRTVLLKANVRWKQHASNIAYFQQIIDNHEFTSELPNSNLLIGTTKRVTEGCICDGGHRVAAAIAEKVDLIWNLEFITQRQEVLVKKYTDANYIRNLATRTGIGKREVEVINYRVHRAAAHSRLTPKDALKYYAEHRDSIDWSTRTFGGKKFGLGRAPTMATFSEMYERNTERAEKFGTAVASEDASVPLAVGLVIRLGRLTSKEFDGSKSKSKMVAEGGVTNTVGGGSEPSRMVAGITRLFCRAYLEGVPLNAKSLPYNIEWDSPAKLPSNLSRTR